MSKVSASSLRNEHTASVGGINGGNVGVDVVTSTKIVLYQGAEIAIPNSEAIAAHRAALRERLEREAQARWGGMGVYIQKEGAALPIEASPYQQGRLGSRANLLETLKAADRLLVLGEPGAGKTVALERLAWELCNGEQPTVPVLVRLFRYAGTSLAGWVRDILRQTGYLRFGDDHTLAAFLAEGAARCVFLLDGLNEVAPPYRDRLVDEIARWLTAHPRHAVILTSRAQDELWRRLRDAATELVVVQPITDEQARGYLETQLPERGSALYARLDERLRALARTPLILWLIKEAGAAGESLPGNRGELYARFVSRLLRRDTERRMDAEIPEMQKLGALTTLADALHRAQRLTCPRAEAMEVVAHEWGDQARMLLQTCERHGLLAGDEVLWFAPHLIVQEHFAARALLAHWERERASKIRGTVERWLKREPSIMALANDDWWAETFVQAAGLVINADEFVQDIMRENPWLAWWCLNEGRQVSANTRSQVEAGTVKLLKSSRSSDRRRAVSALAQLRNERVIAQLFRTVGDANIEVANQAVSALVDMGDVVQPTIRGALQSEERDGIESALRYLRIVPTSKLWIDAVLWAWEKLSITDKRLAVGGLTQLGDEQAIALLQQIARSADTEISEQATQSLVAMGIVPNLQVSTDYYYSEQLNLESIPCNIEVELTGSDLPINVGQVFQLTFRIIPALLTETAVRLPNTSELYCFIKTDGIQIQNTEAALISLHDDSSRFEPPNHIFTATFKLQAHLCGDRPYTIELFAEDPDSGRVSIYKTSGVITVHPPESIEEQLPLLPPLDIRVAPQPDLVLNVATTSSSGIDEMRQLTYYLSSRVPGLRLRNQRVGAVTLRAADYARIQAALQATLQQVAGMQARDARERLLALGKSLFDQCFPPESTREFRQALQQAAGQATTWLIRQDEYTWVPWELLVPYHANETTPLHFLAERYHLSRWIEGLGPPLYSEVPLGEIALAHYKILEAGMEDQDEGLRAWRQLLHAPGVYGILPVVKPETPFYGVHVLYHAGSWLSKRDIVARDSATAPASPEQEAAEARLHLRLKRPVVTLGMWDDKTMPSGTNAEAWQLPERVLPFLRAGASAVIGPWWPTAEAADRIFWPTFYDLLERRVPLGEGVWRARLAVQQALPERPDWLAYALFGDPRARAYWPEPSEGYTVLECLNPDDPLRPGKTYTFRVSLRNRPPIAYTDRLVQPEALPETLRALFLAPGLQTVLAEPVEMTSLGRTMLQATVDLTPPAPGDYPLVVQLLEGDEHVKTLQMTLKVRAAGGSGDD